MMRAFTWLLPDRLGGRIVLVLLIGLTALHLGSLWLHQIDIETLLGTDREAQLAERLVSAHRALTGLDVGKRDQTAHDLSTASLDLHWTATSTVRLSDTAEPRIGALRVRIQALLPELAAADLHLGHGDGIMTGDARHTLLGALRLPDGSWLNFSAALFRAVVPEHAMLLSTSAMAVGILLLGLLVVRLIERPLRALADAADRIGAPGPIFQVLERGPYEVRHAARAFNRMQERIDRLISDRTRALAAVSHDLRTPIARLRLRAGFVENAELQRQIDGDLEEIDTMISSTLAYLRGDQDQEVPRATNLAAILETLCDDAADLGKHTRYTGPPHARFTGRPVALKRAFANLIDNAVHHGGEALVHLAVTAETIDIRVEDAGPGIPEAAMETVFEPFHRLDTARGRGGSGLGLTIARQVVESHGGKISLENRREGGLRITVTLPRREEQRAL